MPHPMTPNEAELLRAVAEAAAWWNAAYKTECPGAGAEHRTALSAASDALSAYRAQPQEATGEAVEVRGCAGVDERGEVYGYCSTRENDTDLRDQIESCGYEPTTMFTVRVFKSPPALPTISAKVVT